MLLERGLVVQVALLDCREVPLLKAAEVRRAASPAGASRRGGWATGRREPCGRAAVRAGRNPAGPPLGARPGGWALREIRPRTRSASRRTGGPDTAGPGAPTTGRATSNGS